MLGPDPSVAPDAPVLRVGTLSKTLGALGGFVAGPAPPHRPRREPGPLLHLHHRVDARRRRRGARRASRSCAGQEGDELRARLRRERGPAPRPATRRRSSRCCAATRQRALDARGRAARPRPARPGDPAADGAARHRRGCGSRSRPRTRSTRSRTLRAALDELALGGDRGDDRLRHRDRHRGRQDLGARPRRSTTLRADGPRRRGPQARAVVRARGARAHRRGAPRRGDGDERRPTVCPAHRWYAIPMAPPMAAAALGLPAFTIADLAAETAARAPAPSASRFVEGAGGPRSPLAADGDNVDLARARRRAASPCSWPTPGSARSTRCGSRVDALRRASTPLGRARTASTPTTTCTARNRGWLADAGYQLLTTVPTLADALAARRSVGP